MRRVRLAAFLVALASAVLLASCAEDEGSPFDASADHVAPSLVSLSISQDNQRVFASWQADEPVHAVVEFEGAADGNTRYAYSGTRDYATSGVTKLLKLDSNATYRNLRVRLRDRAGQRDQRRGVHRRRLPPETVANEGSSSS
jgi:hypothetical protein